jgi:transcriptional regulator with XRE-family HTH domain
MPEHKKAVSRIAALREETGLTQAKLAVLIGVTTNTIQNWESGKSGVDQIEKFLKLCEVLGCDLKDLIEYVPAPEAEQPKAGSFSLDDLRDLRQRWQNEGRQVNTH